MLTVYRKVLKQQHSELQYCTMFVGPFEILKFSLAARLRGHKQWKLNKHVYSFFCLCPLSLVIKLNFNILKGPYSSL